MVKWWHLVPVVLALVVGPAGAAQVAQREATALPDVPLVAAGGAANSSGKAMPAQGRWLLVLVQPNCAPCEALLSKIRAEAPAVAPRLAIVLSRGTSAELAQIAAAVPGLDTSAWYSDEPGALAAALQIQEAPVILAMNDRNIQWTLAGVLSGSQRLRDVLTAWVGAPGE